MRYPAGMPNRYGQPVRDRRPAVLVRADDPENQAAYTISYRVRVAGVRDGLLVLRCSCPSGDYRARLPVPCKHAALAARRLEREGLARWDEDLGGWSPRRPLARARAV